jgi:hypothetical protein
MYAINSNCTHLFARHGVAHQRQVDQLLESRQRIEISQLGNAVLREDYCLQVGYAGREIGLDVRDSVLREEEGAEAGL